MRVSLSTGGRWLKDFIRPDTPCQARCDDPRTLPRIGRYPFDEVLGVVAGCKQLDMQQAAAHLVTEVLYETAQSLLYELTGMSFGSERMHTVTHQVAEGLSVLHVAPTRDEIARRIAAGAAERFRRPVVVLGIDGAYAPTRPESARGRRPGQARQRARRARWRG
jgi:hypothetical protein